MQLRPSLLQAIRYLTSYAIPGLVMTVFVAEMAGLPPPAMSSLARAYYAGLLVVFSLLTVVMIGICGWFVSMWDLDRLFFKLEGKIDSEVAALESKSDGSAQDGMLGRARRMLERTKRGMLGRVLRERHAAVAAIERAYWADINTRGVLAFPRPDIEAAVQRIETSRHDLLAHMADIASRIPLLGSVSASIRARLIFRYLAPEIKVRLYRRLVLRFLWQLGALFVLAALCFYMSLLAWSRLDPAIFGDQGAVPPVSVMLYQLDLMLRGALFDFMEHTHQSIAPIRLNPGIKPVVYYTLLFRMFVTFYVVSSIVRVFRFALRRWRVLFPMASRLNERS